MKGYTSILIKFDSIYVHLLLVDLLYILKLEGIFLLTLYYRMKCKGQYFARFLS